MSGLTWQVPAGAARLLLRGLAPSPRVRCLPQWRGWPLLAALVVIAPVQAVPMTPHAALPPTAAASLPVAALTGATPAPVATTVAVSGPAAGAATEPVLPTAAWPTGTVLELLHLDAQQALAQALGGPGVRGSLRPEAAAPAASAPVVDRIEVAAIYGTAGRLTAVLYINGRRKEYRPGAPLPVGSATARGEYRLLRIADGCVWLAAGARQRSACYDAAALPTSAFGREPPVPSVEQPGNVALAQPLAPYPR